jgi:hypothetical protein
VKKTTENPYFFEVRVFLCARKKTSDIAESLFDNYENGSLRATHQAAFLPLTVGHHVCASNVKALLSLPEQGF